MRGRRWFLQTSLALGAGLVARSLRAQGTGEQAQGADQLRWPDAVQTRAVVGAGDDDEIVKGIERRLKCTCGCNLDIFTCRTTDFTCPVSPALHRQIVALRGDGRTPNEIVAAFVEEHGEEILMAPEPQGFNLAGYLVPGIAVLAASSLLAMVLFRRQRLAPVVVRATESELSTDGLTPLEGTSPAEIERLRQALDATAD